ncbi:hypothetical protein B0H63DRAFT_565571 [Podospora didyma]|uniref:LysM domain-containing protein n=1 Tax=Podospora didyma TaxID=330526 RepID=A0AAE0K0W5_9PEZI|nr:hypothetical protein B0H63DRAFT_565571 [Podospora didyma]
MKVQFLTTSAVLALHLSVVLDHRGVWDSCSAIDSPHGITVSEFETVYNPSVGTTCKLTTRQSCCVERNFGIPPVITTTATPKSSSTATAAATGNGITTPLPTQASMISSCNKFYKTMAGDFCAVIASSNGIPLNDFYAWNTRVGSACESLWVDTNYCMGIIGQATSTSKPISSTQAGMIASCNRFYKTKAGDACTAIATANNIALSDFAPGTRASDHPTSRSRPTRTTAWASSAKTNSSSTSKKTSTSTTKKTSTPTSTGNDISTPTPVQPGMTPNRDKSYLVVVDDECAAIATKYGITLAQFYAWNKQVGANCETLFGVVVTCVSIPNSDLWS